MSTEIKETPARGRTIGFVLGGLGVIGVGTAAVTGLVLLVIFIVVMIAEVVTAWARSRII